MLGKSYVFSERLQIGLMKRWGIYMGSRGKAMRQRESFKKVPVAQFLLRKVENKRQEGCVTKGSGVYFWTLAYRSSFSHNRIV